MADFSLNSPTGALRWRWLGRLVDRLCWVVLVVVMGVVIVGLLRRAHFEHSYALAVIIALFGAFVLLVGLAQQAIAARDLETWRVMAEWQLRAARDRAGLYEDIPSPNIAITPANAGDEDHARYFALLSDILVEEMMDIHDDGVARGN